MTSLHKKIVIIALIIQLVFGGIANLQFNYVRSLSLFNYLFSLTTISKVYEDYLYVSQANQFIRKINLTNLAQWGMFQYLPGTTVNDFVVYANGTKMVVSYSDNTLVQWNTYTFTIISNVSAVCDSLVYLDDVNRFVCSIPTLTGLEMRQTDLSLANSIQLGSNNRKYKFCLSSNRNILIGMNEQQQFGLGNFFYTNISMSFTQFYYFPGAGSNYNRKIYTAENVPFTFYFIKQMAIYQLDASNSTASGFVHTAQDIIIAFKQIVNDRVAYVMPVSNKTVNFIGKGNFNFSYAFPIASDIKDIQISLNKRNLILILQTQIQIYQLACINNQHYDPAIFDCAPCPAVCLTCFSNSPNCSSCLLGSFINNQTCSACDISCQTCENSTGCLTCAGSLRQIGTGLLCSNLINPSISSSNSTNSTTNQDVPYNETKAIYNQILEDAIYFMNIPSSLRIPFQSSFLVYIGDFWIYNYHNRTYGQKVSKVFQVIQIIESHKWALAKFDKHLNLTLDPHYLGFSNYSNYSNPKFLEVENKSSTFVESLQQYFLYFLPTVILGFLFYRFIFYKTFHYRISRHFRKYSLNLFIFFLLTEGNFEYLCYCCFNQSQMLYFFNFIDKINAQIWLLFFFLATIHAFGTFYIAYWFYPKLSGKFIDEAKKMLPSFTMYTVMANSKNFILAAIQSFLFKHYVAQMFSILGVNCLLIGIILYIQIKYGIFKRAIFFNFLLLQITIKIFVNFLLLVQYCVEEGENSTFDLLEDCLMIVLYLWGIVVILGIISSFFPQMKKIKKQTSAQQKKKKKNKQFGNLSDEVNNLTKKAESRPKKGLKNMRQKLKNSLKFENRLDVVIIEYQDEKPIRPKNLRQKQINKSNKQSVDCPKLYNQRTMTTKSRNYVFNQRKNRIRNQRKDQRCIFMVEICNKKVSDNHIQELQFGPKLQASQ